MLSRSASGERTYPYSSRTQRVPLVELFKLFRLSSYILHKEILLGGQNGGNNHICKAEILCSNFNFLKNMVTSILFLLLIKIKHQPNYYVQTYMFCTRPPPVYTYSSHRSGGVSFHKIHQPYLFKYYSLYPELKQTKKSHNFGPPRKFLESLAPKLNQVGKYHHFGPPRQFWDILSSQQFKYDKLLSNVIVYLFMLQTP